MIGVRSMTLDVDISILMQIQPNLLLSLEYLKSKLVLKFNKILKI